MNDSYEKAVALAQVITAMKDAFLPQRETKDRIVQMASEILIKELEKIKRG